MRIIFKVLLCIGMTLGIAHVSLAGEWRGIVPLHSTCDDVKHILGVTTCQGSYELQGESVYIWFSYCPCYEKMGLLEKWNVPRGTVTAISVRPKRRLQLSDFRIEESKYKKASNPNGSFVYYTDEEAGITFMVNSLGDVKTISYMPAAKDNHLRCPRSLENESQEVGNPHGTRMFDEYGNLSIAEERKRLDSFTVELHSSIAEVKGYILFYEGRRGRAGEAQARAEHAKSYLISKGMDSRRIVIMDGGYREELTLTLYTVLPGGSIPFPLPSVCPDEVQVERRGRRKRAMKRIHN